MRPVLSRAQSATFDRLAVERWSVPGVVLMENAGRGAADAIVELLAARRVTHREARVFVVAGPGNNGGDGYVVARRLRVQGVPVELGSAVDPEKLQGDARVMHDAWLGVGGRVWPLMGAAALEGLEQRLGAAHVVVDGLLGTGLERPVTGSFGVLIELMNRAPALRVALDLPSGISADRGEVLGVAVRAQHTLCFGHPKLGLFGTAGIAHSGAVQVLDIGVPPGLVREVGHAAELTEPEDLAELLRPRGPTAHKGSAGRVVIFAGSPGKLGAALLAARGARRGGAGLVTLAGFPETVALLEQRVLEEMTARLEPEALVESVDAALEGANAVVIGPGLGFGERERALVERVVLRWGGPVVVDADALGHFNDQPTLLAEARGPRLLTPHPAELGRLLELSAAKVESDRYAALARAVEATRCTVLLKGPRTLIGAPKALPRINPSGHAVLATGGTGDVLAGLAGALACHWSLPDAASLAAWLHGRAAERWAAGQGADRGLEAHEVADGLPAAFAELLRQRQAQGDGREPR